MRFLIDAMVLFVIIRPNVAYPNSINPNYLQYHLLPTLIFLLPIFFVHLLSLSHFPFSVFFDISNYRSPLLWGLWFHDLPSFPVSQYIRKFASCWYAMQIVDFPMSKHALKVLDLNTTFWVIDAGAWVQHCLHLIDQFLGNPCCIATYQAWNVHLLVFTKKPIMERSSGRFCAASMRSKCLISSRHLSYLWALPIACTSLHSLV